MKIKPATAAAMAAARDRKPVVTVIRCSLGCDRSAPIRMCSLSGFGGSCDAFTLRPSIAPFQRWERGERDDLRTAQRLEEWLEAATHQAGELVAADRDLADTRGAGYLPRRRGADEGHVDSVRVPRFGHVRRLISAPAAHIV